MESENEEPNVIYYENKFLLAKFDTNSDAFDVLVFARRDIDDVVVPSFIKTIASSAFGDFIKLKKKIKVIDDYLFSYCSIDSILISLQVERIVKEFFFYVNQLNPLNSLKILK